VLVRERSLLDGKVNITLKEEDAVLLERRFINGRGNPGVVAPTRVLGVFPEALRLRKSVPIDDY
jgi:hypothetical protein